MECKYISNNQSLPEPTMTYTYLKIKDFITVEDQHKSSQLVAKSFDRRRLAGTCGTKGRASQPGKQGLGHGQIAAVSCLIVHQLLLHSQVLKAIVELGIGHMDGQLLENVRLFGVKVEAHLTQPLKRLGIVDFLAHHFSCYITLMYQLFDLYRKRILVITCIESSV